MLKLFIVITVFAGGVFGSVTPPEKKKLAVEKAFEELWKQRCKNVSGVELDIEKYDRLHEEYEACINNTFDITQFQDESIATLQKSNFTNLDGSSLTQFFQKYCPKVYNYLNCKKKLFPIMNECYTAEENFGQTVVTDINKRLSDFFCENDGSHITEFISGKIVDCGATKKLELTSCYEQYYLNMLSMDPVDLDNDDSDFSPFSFLPRADTTCKSLKTFGICVVPVFQQCELSETPGKLLTLLFNYLQTETKCAGVNAPESTVS